MLGKRAIALFLPFALLLLVPSEAAQVIPRPPSKALPVTVVDENGVAVSGARISLQPSAEPLLCVTDFAGHCRFQNLSPGTYQLRVEKVGFYATVQPGIHAAEVANVDVTLSHLQEVREEVNVVESVPAIDNTQTANREKLTNLDVIDIPYPATRDYRNVLNYIPGVVQTADGQPHIAGAETYQALTLLDGFNVTQPANGQLLLRVSTDAIRSINVETSRYSAEYGKGSGGVLDINTGIGADHFRFIATDFVPSLQNKKGLTLDKITPRVTVSGPLRKGKVWFFEGADGEYDNVVFTELPNGADRDIVWRAGNLAKIQANPTPRNIITTSFLYNHTHDQHFGFSTLSPQQATPVLDAPVYDGSIKDQYTLPGGELLEAGLGFNRYVLSEIPRGLAPYFITPVTTGGNYYFRGNTEADRLQFFTNLYLPPRQWHGRHEFKVGIDADRLRYDFSFLRQPISFLRCLNSNGQECVTQAPPEGENCLTLSQMSPLPSPFPCTRYSVFPGAPAFEAHNVELSGYAQDRWSPAERLLVEYGIRYDWDEIVRHSLLSPRLAASYGVDRQGNTKLSAGIGLFYDATPLFLIVRPRAGERIDSFFDSSGNLIGTTTSTFSLIPGTLEAPRFVNWSLAVEHKLPASIYMKVEFVEKRGTNGFVYNTINGAPGGNFVLENTRQDHYDAVQLQARRTFRNGHMIIASYTRSRTRSNQVLDFNVDNPVLSPQEPGPYPWDAPNRFLSWGFLPFIKGFDVAYSMEVRDGFPFNLVDDLQRLIPPAESHRFPAYFTLNLHLEKRFHLFRAWWAIRGGFDNITDRHNFVFVNNDINPAHPFPTFSGFSGRAFTTRIRFLGRK